MAIKDLITDRRLGEETIFVSVTNDIQREEHTFKNYLLDENEDSQEVTEAISVHATNEEIVEFYEKMARRIREGDWD